MSTDYNILPNIRILLSPTLDCIWINIPKNGSSFVQKVLQDTGWRLPHPDSHDGLLRSNIRKFFILRNPVERFISGFAECFIDDPSMLDLLDNPTFLRVLARNPVYDGHTTQQHLFIPDTSNSEHIYLGSGRPPQRFFFNVQEWVRENGGQADCGTWNDAVNPRHNDDNKLAINTKLREIIRNDKKFEESIVDFYSQDSDLLTKIKRKEYNGPINGQ